MRMKGPKDFWAGLMFLGFGLGFLAMAQTLSMGTAVRMGAGYFPRVLGGFLAILGVLIFFKAFLVDGLKVPRLYLKPNLFVLGALVLWALLLRPLGLVLSTAVMIFVAALGGFDFRWKEVFILSVALIAGAVGVFVYGLGLPFALWPGR
jgi:hypothetical protein